MIIRNITEHDAIYVWCFQLYNNIKSDNADPKPTPTSKLQMHQPLFQDLIYSVTQKGLLVAVLEGLPLLCNLCARIYARVSRLCANSVFLSRPPTVMQYLSLATALQSIIRFCCDTESSISFIFT